MKKMLGLLMVVAAGGLGGTAQAGGGCRVTPTYATQVIYVPVEPVVVQPVYRYGCEPVRVCTSAKPTQGGMVYAPRVMAQPGYWVLRDTGCGRVQRVWQPSRRVVVSSYYPGTRFVRASW